MKELLEWITSFNDSNYNPQNWTLDHYDINSLTTSYKRMLINQYREKSNPNDNTNYPLRPSMLGKPALLIAYMYYHPNTACAFPNKNARMASIGYYFEEWVYAKLLGLGYYVNHDVEDSLIWWNHEIKCHADFVIQHRDSDKAVIIECKELSDYYYKQWTKYKQAEDDRGYLTQASIYSQAFNLPLIWILGNRATGEIDYRILTKEEKTMYYDRAEEIVRVLLNDTSCWEECFKFMEPEPPNVTKKGLTVPFAMKPIANVVYELDDKGYVLDYKYPKGYEQYKPEI